MDFVGQLVHPGLMFARWGWDAEDVGVVVAWLQLWTVIYVWWS